MHSIVRMVSYFAILLEIKLWLWFFFIIKNKSPSNLEARLMHAVFILPLAVRRSSSVFHNILQSSVDHPTLFKNFHGLSCLQLLFPIWGRRAIKKKYLKFRVKYTLLFKNCILISLELITNIDSQLCLPAPNAACRYWQQSGARFWLCLPGGIW